MPRESNLAFKVGLFVLVAFAVLTIFIFSVSDTSVFTEGQSLRVVFEFANGLKKNAPVRIAGVDEGIVKDINLFFDRKERKTKVNVDLWIKKNTRIPSDSVILINQLGLMGEKYIEVLPGKDTENFFKIGETLLGKDPVSQEAISQRIMEVADKLEITAGGVNKLMHNQKNLDSVEKILKNLSTVTTGLDEIIYNIKKGNGTIGRLIYDEGLYKDIQGLSADLKENPWKLLRRPKKK